MMRWAVCLSVFSLVNAGCDVGAVDPREDHLYAGGPRACELSPVIVDECMQTDCFLAVESGCSLPNDAKKLAFDVASGGFDVDGWSFRTGLSSVLRSWAQGCLASLPWWNTCADCLHSALICELQITYPPGSPGLGPELPPDNGQAPLRPPLEPPPPLPSFELDQDAYNACRAGPCGRVDISCGTRVLADVIEEIPEQTDETFERDVVEKLEEEATVCYDVPAFYDCSVCIRDSFILD